MRTGIVRENGAWPSSSWNTPRSHGPTSVAVAPFSPDRWGCSGAGSAPRSWAAAATSWSAPFLVERCILHSRMTVRTALSSARCTSGRQGAPVAAAVRPAPAPAGTRGGAVSESVAKALVESKRRKRIVDIPRFYSWPIPARGDFATDSDTSSPRPIPRVLPTPPVPGISCAPGPRRDVPRA